MIKLNKISKVYRTDEIESTALNEVSLEIGKGEFVSIMGPSGCGKSTLLNVLGMLDKPERVGVQSAGGSYKFLDSEVADLNEKGRSDVRKKNIGFIFQNFNLIDELTVFESIELPLLYNKIGLSECKQRVNELIEKIGISHRASHYPQQLSGGQQQRVAVARALITKPPLILADEPTGNLDSSHGNEVMELLCQLNEEGTTIIMVTHSSHDASYSDRIINLLDGQIVSEKKSKMAQAAV
ncbi:MAG: ABC transporter ATP-binding protein [Cytophagales bacterium]|nr:ABC transporter ATP-binding protein [Cytophagales bacterium]